jgi:hypothetical protein
MQNSNVGKLKHAVEQICGGKATYVQSVPVVHGNMIAVVSIFDLAGHSRRNRAYAWSSRFANNVKGYSAIVHDARCTSPAAALGFAAALAD